MFEAGVEDDVDVALLGLDASEDEVRRHRTVGLEEVSAGSRSGNMGRECTSIEMAHKGSYVAYYQRLRHPLGRRGYATAQDAPSARVSAWCAAPLSSPNLGPAPQFVVEQPVDDEDRPFDPPELAQRQGKIVLARIGG